MTNTNQNLPGLEIKKCEVFGCSNTGSRMCQIAPGTNVWICEKCKKEMEEKAAA